MPPKSPPTAPDIVFLGLNLGQSFLPPIKLPTKYAKTSVADDITKVKIKAIRLFFSKWFVKTINNTSAFG